MQLATIVLLSVVAAFFTCTTSKMGTAAPPETPSDVVRQYVTFARNGEFEKVASLTTSSLSGKPTPASSTNTIPEIKKETLKFETETGFTIAPDDEAFADGLLKWVRSDFPKSIYDEKLSIGSVKRELAKDTEARVEIILRNETKIELIGWAFLLRKVDGKWKIYDITTRGAPVENL